MARSYYYIIAGLPDFGLDDKAPLPDFHHFADEITPLLAEEDAAFLYLLRLHYDNKNLASLLHKEDGGFAEGGNFSMVDLAKGLHEPDELPPYMKTVIEAWRHDLPIYPTLSWEDQISWLFHDYVKESSNPFLRDWFDFDLKLRNLLTALKCRSRSIPVEHRLTERLERECSYAIIGRDDIAELILESTAPDFDVTPHFPYMEALLSLHGAAGAGIEESEKEVDRIRWRWLSDRTRFNYFDIERVLSVCIKLGIANRWKRLTPESGQKRLEEMLGMIEGACSFDAGQTGGTVWQAV